MSDFLKGALFSVACVVATAAPAFAADPIVVLDLQKIYSESEAGKSAQAQLKTIGDNLQKAIDPEAKALEAEDNSTWTPRFKDKNDQQISADLEKDQALKTKYIAFVQRRNALLQKSDVSRAELQATQQAAVQAVLQAVGPDIKSSMAAKGASVVLEKDAVVASADAVDITADVMTRFNARVKTVPVAKVSLTQPQK